MGIFRKLFSFSREEVQTAFKTARLKKKALGFKLLQAEINTEASPSPENLFGKLLIITPRACGKAHERNELRRRAKAIFFQERLYEKPITSLLLVYQPAMKLTFEELKQFLIENIWYALSKHPNWPLAQLFVILNSFQDPGH